MKLEEMWKSKMKESLTKIYGEGIDQDKLDKYLSAVIEAKRSKFPKLWMRNLYTQRNFAIELNDIFDIVKKEDLCISGNGLLTFSLDKCPTIIPNILINKKAERNLHKKKMLQAKGRLAVLEAKGLPTAGTPDDLIAQNENSFQLKVKVFMNSVYGVQGQKGSYLYAPDTAGAVTSQGRQLISEMLWTIERLLYGTIYFDTVNEFMNYLITLKNECHENSEYLKYISYYPTVEDVKHRIIQSIHKTVGLSNTISKMDVTIYRFINNLTPQERVYFYYKNNMFDLYSKNKKVFDLFDEIINLKIPFLALCKKPKDEEEEKYSHLLSMDFHKQEIYDGVVGPINYKDLSKEQKVIINYLGYHFINPILEEICKVLDEFVIMFMPTPNRTKKYKYNRRRAIVVSDTDSVIFNVHPHVANLYKLHCQVNGEEYKGEHVGFFDSILDYKLANMIMYICTHGTVVAGDVLAKYANIPARLREKINMKSEFLFKRLVAYSNVKKNYAANTVLQEGELIDEIAKTGIKLNSSNIHPDVGDKINKCIEDHILRTEHVDPIIIMKDLKDIEAWIITEIQKGNLTLGKRARYSGANGYKTGVYQNDAGRAAYIWNLLYPEAKIQTGDYGYIFNLTLETVNDLKKVEAKGFYEEAKLLRSLIFENPNEPKLEKYGLRCIMIPISESVKQLPDWMIPFVNYARLTNKHLQPLISLLPSVGLKLSALSSSKQTYSPLTTFS